MENDIKKGQVGAGLSGTKFSEYFENSPIGFYICDPKGKLIYFYRSAEKLWGRALFPERNPGVAAGSFIYRIALRCLRKNLLRPLRFNIAII